MSVSDQHASSVEIICKSIAPPLWNPLTEQFNFNKEQLTIVAIHTLDFYHRVEWCMAFLDERELERAQRFFNHQDRNRFIISKAVLRKLAGNYLQIPPREIRFSEGVNKKPFIEGNNNLCFNISHSGSLTVIAISNGDIGIDIEQIDPRIEYSEISAEVFSEMEISEVKAANDPLNFFYRFWTRKEALIKATSKGIDDDFRRFSCLDGINYLDGKLIGTNQNWTVQTFGIQKDYLCSLACMSGLDPQLNYFRVIDLFLSDSK